MHGPGVEIPRSVEGPIESPKKSSLHAFTVVAQEDGRKRGRQSQRVEGGNRHRESNRERKLPKEDSRGPRKESHGDKYGNQNEGGCDYGACDLLHGNAGGIVRLRDPFDDMTLYVFNNHDGVIDDDTSRQGDSKQRERIDRKTEHFHKNERADQRDRNCHRRNESAPPIL